MAPHSAASPPSGRNAPASDRRDYDVLQRLAALEQAHKAKEAEEFLERVEEVHETIRGLIDGTVDANELERQEERAKWREKAKHIKKEEERAREQEALAMGCEGKGENARRPYTFFCRACLVEFTLPSMTDCSRCGRPVMTREARLAQLEEKVGLLKEEKAKHLTRKARWKQWLNTRKHVRRSKVIHYQTWEIWEPSTDEEERENAAPITPANDPTFQALEKDLKASETQRQSRKRAAIRCKERGNLLLKKGDLVGALEAYDEGLEHRRDVKELWTNKALVLLKLKKYEEVCQAVTTLLEYCEIFEDGYEKSAAACFKALCRRALAQRALHRWEEALCDFRQATRLYPKDCDANSLLKETEMQVLRLRELDSVFNERQTAKESNACTAEKRQSRPAPVSPPFPSASSSVALASISFASAEQTGGSQTGRLVPETPWEGESATAAAALPESAAEGEAAVRGRTNTEEADESKRLAIAGERGSEPDAPAEADSAHRGAHSGRRRTAKETDAKTAGTGLEQERDTAENTAPGRLVARCFSSASTAFPSPRSPTACSPRFLASPPNSSPPPAPSSHERPSPLSSSSSASVSSRCGQVSSPDAGARGAACPPGEAGHPQPALLQPPAVRSLHRLDAVLGDSLRRGRTFASLSGSRLQESLQILREDATARLWFWDFPLALSRGVRQAEEEEGEVGGEREGEETQHAKEAANPQPGPASVSAELHGARDQPGGAEEAREAKGGEQRDASRARQGAVARRREKIGDTSGKIMSPRDVAIEEICAAASQVRRLQREREEWDLRSDSHSGQPASEPAAEAQQGTLATSRTLQVLVACANALRCLHCVCSFTEAAASSAADAAESPPEAAAQEAPSGLRRSSSPSASPSAPVSLWEVCDASASALLTLLGAVRAAGSGAAHGTAPCDREELLAVATAGSSPSSTASPAPGGEGGEGAALGDVKALLLGLLHAFSLQAMSRRKLVEHLLRRRDLGALILDLLAQMRRRPRVPLRAREDAGALLCNLLLERSVQVFVAASARPSGAAGAQAAEGDCGRPRTSRDGSAKGANRGAPRRSRACGREVAREGDRGVPESAESRRVESQAETREETTAQEILPALWDVVHSRVKALTRRQALQARLERMVHEALMDSGGEEEIGDATDTARKIWRELDALQQEATEGAAEKTRGFERRRRFAEALGRLRSAAARKNDASLSQLLAELAEDAPETDQVSADVKQCLSILTNLSRLPALRLAILKNLQRPLYQLTKLLGACAPSSWELPSCRHKPDSPAFSAFSVPTLPAAEFLGLLANLTTPGSATRSTQEDEALGAHQRQLLADEAILTLLRAFIAGTESGGDEANDARARVVRLISQREAELLITRSLTLACRLISAVATSESSASRSPGAGLCCSSPSRPPSPPSSASSASSLTCFCRPLSSGDVARALCPPLCSLLRLPGPAESGAAKSEREGEAGDGVSVVTSHAVQLLCALAQQAPFLATAAEAEAALQSQRGEREAKSEGESAPDSEARRAAQKEECRRGGCASAETQPQDDEKRTPMRQEKSVENEDTERGARDASPHAEASLRLTAILKRVCDLLQAVAPQKYAESEDEMKTPRALIRGNLLLFVGLAAKAQLAATTRNSEKKRGQLSVAQNGNRGAQEGSTPPATSATGRVEPEARAAETFRAPDARHQTDEATEKRDGGDCVLEALDMTGAIFCCIEALRKDVGGPQRNAAVTLAALAQVAKYKPAIVALRGMESLMQIAVPLLLGKK
ncbi:tetratricopeptide repeat-containing protein [Besnoitia besnoiti]|uniref:Tetratricopeptide repeat-containing protein n=1 Tax=Besnoitia besnoiti TaxID=94643 RepID=A0A2A9LXT0_BESBE|nr:tetratricopeptide repeat-containing protein [Besnoitia besnoiti]PFH31288.1 tetratricopeptide repeat-containing protein [Besnoitia besnoiti]